MTVAERTPRAGVGVMILKKGTVLLHRRIGAHGAGEWAFPGGHLEHLESFADCARRETRQECGIEIQNIRFLFLANVTHYAPKHYVHVGLLADWASGDPTARETDRGEAWGWYAFDSLPQPMFKMCELALASYWNRQTYYDVAGQ